jgi:flagellin
MSPEDDAAGLAVWLRFDAQINRASAITGNLGNTISFSQTQDGFLQKVQKALDRMSELATLSLDETKQDSDRELYQKEFTELQNYVNDVTIKTFNGTSLFSSTDLSIAIDTEQDDIVVFTMTCVDLSGGSYTNALTTGTTSIETKANAETALANVKDAINNLASDRAQVGANIVRLQSTAEQTAVLKDNLIAANSRIKDVDVADESTIFARYNILVQAGTAMLAQANTSPQAALRLLQ